MHLSDRLLTTILGKPSTSDAEELLHALAQEVRMLRAELAQMRQTFVPLVNAQDPRGAAFMAKFRDLCTEEKIAAAVVLGYVVDGDLALHYGGHQGIVTALQNSLKLEDDHA